MAPNRFVIFPALAAVLLLFGSNTAEAKRAPPSQDEAPAVTTTPKGVVVEKLQIGSGKANVAKPVASETADRVAPSAAAEGIAEGANRLAIAAPRDVDVAIKTDCKDVASTQTATDDSLQSKVRNAVDGGDWFLSLLLILFAGFLTALSPCVYPLIPITLSIFGARQATSPIKGFLLSSSYVGGMVVLYTTLGTTFAAFGFLAGSALQSPLITIGVALFCVAMAASMFGAFEFALPASLQNKLSQMGGAGFKGAFVMGLVAGIIAAPCTGPVLSFILTLIAKDGDVAKGAAFMFAYAVGMGLPFLVLGTFSSALSSIPKSGRWMETVKSIFGIMMLSAGLYYLQFGIPAVADGFKELAPLGVYLAPGGIVFGVLIGALNLSFKDSSVVDKIRKGVGVAAIVVGLLAGVAWLTTSPEPPQGKVGAKVTFIKIGTEAGGLEKYDFLLAEAKKACKPVMIDFYADWCVACKELDKLTYPDPKVAAESLRFTNIKIDATADGPTSTALQKRYGVVGLPTVVFINGRGEVLNDPRVTGFEKAEPYLEIMKRVR